ncbi:MAG TPA: Sir2 family NAD-dependent protein deacetylase [Thermoanaerobaculia bacterium]|jgi:NAD-dependent SIR2 family protein deacetylase
MTNPQESIEQIAQWILAAKHVVAFTGAGISTDSGIPDFRGPDGVWTRRDAGLPAPQWKVRPDQVRPNASHAALVDLQRMGKLAFLITQNTDNLHRESGIAAERIAELHGNGHLMRCLACDEQFSRAETGWGTGKWGPGYRTDRPKPGQPPCPACGGRLISSVVNFGDPLPLKEIELSRRHASRCDLMLVLGSSLVVQPAASFVGIALQARARVVLINKGETPYDEVATLRLWTGIGEVLPPAVDLVRRAHNE